MSVDLPIEAVLFDLDDTLYPQSAWLGEAWQAVGRAAAGLGVDGEHLHQQLVAVAAEGSDRGRIIDKALERAGVRNVPVRRLVDEFRRFEASRILTYPGVSAALARLRSRVPIGLVTDGDPDVQRSKLRALRLEKAFDVVVFSDELGRSRRKPHPAPLVRAAQIVGATPARCVYVGDRPEKDVAAALAARMRAIRVRTGEYAWAPDVPRPWFSARDLPRALDRLMPSIAADDATPRGGKGG